MKKYDCNKTLDYSHELGRICRSCDCAECLVGHLPCSVDRITQEHIDIVQKWSDTHPEALKLTKRERAFLECLSSTDNKVIYRTNGGEVYVKSFYTNERFFINGTTFKFINKGDGMSVKELLELEVQDD